LLVSLSGITPRTLHRCADLAAELDRRKVPLSVLYAARTGGGPVTEWVRTRARAGDSVLLHGYDHTVTPTHRTVYLGKKAEFATLPAHEARLRLIAAKAALDNTGLTVDGFAPPRWIASTGTLQALAEHGFRLCADLGAVRDLVTGEVRRARVSEFTPVAPHGNGALFRAGAGGGPRGPPGWTGPAGGRRHGSNPPRS